MSFKKSTQFIKPSTVKKEKSMKQVKTKPKQGSTTMKVKAVRLAEIPTIAKWESHKEVKAEFFRDDSKTIDNFLSDFDLLYNDMELPKKDRAQFKRIVKRIGKYVKAREKQKFYRVQLEDPRTFDIDSYDLPNDKKSTFVMKESDELKRLKVIEGKNDKKEPRIQAFALDKKDWNIQADEFLVPVTAKGKRQYEYLQNKGYVITRNEFNDFVIQKEPPETFSEWMEEVNKKNTKIVRGVTMKMLDKETALALAKRTRDEMLLIARPDWKFPTHVIEMMQENE